MRRSNQELDAEMELIKGKVRSAALNIPGHWVNYDDTNGFDQEIKWMNGQLPMANIEISQGLSFTTFRVHEYTFEPEEKRTKKKQRMVTQKFSEAFNAVNELLS